MCPSPDGHGGSSPGAAPAAAPLQFHPPTAVEDRARAGYYALLARLFYSGPDAGLLQTIAGAEEIVEDHGSGLAGAWRALAAAARAMDAEAVRGEHDEAFVGVGKADVTPYASYYLSETGREKVVVRLRQQLADMGLARTDRAREPEDHFAGLFEVMRHLISDSGDAALQKQKRFFAQFIGPAYSGFCTAISKSSKTNFYKHVAEFARHFLDIESESLKVF
jgi:TorA maturation chaperone TorD